MFDDLLWWLPELKNTQKPSLGCFSYKQRIVEWLGLEGTSSIIEFQPSCHGQGCQPLDLVLDHIAQGPIQPGLKHLQDSAYTTSLGSLFQHLTSLSVKKIPPDNMEDSVRNWIMFHAPVSFHSSSRGVSAYLCDDLLIQREILSLISCVQ